MIFLLLTFLISTLTIRMLIPVAHYLKLIDHPGKHRSHFRPTPLIGGISIFMTLLVTVMYKALHGTQVYSQYPTILLFSVLLLVIVSCVDDQSELTVSTRFFAQAISVLLLISISGIQLNSFGNWSDLLSIHSQWLSVFITVIALIGSMNAMNMIDGLDGLAGGIGLISLAMLAFIAWGSGLNTDFSFLIRCCGAVCGFLVYNLRWGKRQHATVFLGDAGSVLLGFLIGAYLIRFSQSPVNAMPPTTALWIFAVPLMDTICLILHRLLQKKSPVKASRDHLHHILKRAGLSTKSVVTSILILHLAFGITGCLAMIYSVPEKTMFLMFMFSFAVFFAIRQSLVNYSSPTLNSGYRQYPPIKR